MSIFSTVGGLRTCVDTSFPIVVSTCGMSIRASHGLCTLMDTRHCPFVRGKKCEWMSHKEETDQMKGEEERERERERDAVIAHLD